eukprot:TRINITY_DN655_c1_g2_i8.p1 TRINITY_DN655_c1_g2~~TRINITY_DN655_c1_g2_i8.p1  ORF type:complete len:113 (+),score=6.72 TRINITY_DN655_c1_g2_i8:228-566(+)
MLSIWPDYPSYFLVLPFSHSCSASVSLSSYHHHLACIALGCSVILIRIEGSHQDKVVLSAGAPMRSRACRVCQRCKQFHMRYLLLFLISLRLLFNSMGPICLKNFSKMQVQT